MILLRTAIGAYPHTECLRSGRVGSDEIRLAFENIAPISRAFAPMVREARFDFSEIAIATFLQAKAFGKPLVLLPVAVSARFQEGALLCRGDSDIQDPAGLAGRRVGVRAYSQTTGVWLRGIMQDEYGLDSRQVHWITFEDAHVSEYQDPPWAQRERGDLLGMLRAGELDAAIFGAEMPDAPDLRPVFPDPAAAGAGFLRKHGFVPVNHLLCVRRELADAAAPELLRMLAAARTEGAPPHGRAGLEPAFRLIMRYMLEQGLLAHPLGIDEVWDGLPAAAGEE